MKLNRKIIPMFLLAALCVGAFAQVENSGVVRRRTEKERKKQETSTSPGVTDRMQGFFETKEPHEADLEYMREIYRVIDLEKPENAPLYFPEDVIDGKENLFRMIFGLVVNGKIPAYEYLDGREVFTDKYKINVQEMLDRFDIYYTPNGSQFQIEDADVPTNQVLNYYIIEKWEFDRRSNQMKTRIEAICPVLNRTGDYGGEARYPMFWVKFDQLRPYLAQQYIFLDDDNNLANYSLDDYFNLGMYQGDIYKTQNLRNLSMMQMYPDEEELKRAQDSIDNRLRNYAKNLWVPTREEYLAMMAEKEERERLLAENDTLPERVFASESVKERKSTASSTKKNTKKRGNSQPKVKESNTGNVNAEKSVRRRKK